MLSIVLCSHADFAIGLKNAVELICGPIDDLYALTLNENMSLDELKINIYSIYEQEFQKKQEILFLVDLEHATPYNACMMALADTNAIMMTGMSLPMLLELVTKREHSEYAIALCKEVIEKSIESIKLEIPKEFLQKEE